MSARASKVLSAEDVAKLLPRTTQPIPAALENIIAPTADELLNLVEEALRDTNIDADLSADQSTRLRAALIARLGASLTGST